MRRVRVIRGHWGPFWAHARLAPVNYAFVVVVTAWALGLLSILYHDPEWVGLSDVAVQVAYSIAWLILQISAYRNCTGHRLDRDQTYTRDDIWKDEWPW